MAYWGEAMTFNHPVWNELDVQAGQAALAKFGPTPEARAQRIADPRERAWFSAVEILFSGAGSKPERDARYATAMQQLTPRVSERRRSAALLRTGAAGQKRRRARRSHLPAGRGDRESGLHEEPRPSRRGPLLDSCDGRPAARRGSARARACVVEDRARVRRTRNICARTFFWHWECGMTWCEPTSRPPP